MMSLSLVALTASGELCFKPRAAAASEAMTTPWSSMARTASGLGSRDVMAPTAASVSARLISIWPLPPIGGGASEATIASTRRSAAALRKSPIR